MRKIVTSGLVVVAALLGCAGPAFAGTGTTGTAGTVSTATTGADAGPAGTGTASGDPATGTADAAIARMASSRSVAARVAARHLESLLERRPQASGSGSLYIGTGLSCASPTACLSIGMAGSTNSGKLVPTAERLHAGTWKSIPVKTPKGALMTMLDGVSCKAATYCLVMGESLGDSASFTGGDSPVALSWNGTALTLIAAPPVPKTDELDALEGVSCVAIKSCVVLGAGDVLATGYTLQFVWTLNGSKWTLTTVPDPDASTTTEFSSLHCFSPASCIAAGGSMATTESSTEGPTITGTQLVSYWNGTTFTSLNAPAPSGTADMEFTGLSCVSTRACAATGVASDPSGIKTLGFAEVWNGKAWTVTKWSGPKGDTDAELLDVSCTSAVRCIAVGEHGTGKTFAPASLAWGGSKWTLLKVPGAGSGKGAVFGNVSCPVNGTCVATGESGTIGGTTFTLAPLAGYWNGRAWTYGPMFPAA